MGFILDVLIELLESMRESQREKLQQKGKSDNAVKSNVYIVKRNNRSVTRNFRPLWQERQWKKSEDSFVGYYRTPYGSYSGLITERAPGYIKFYIYEPPACLSRHSHFACFLPKGDKLYEVHFTKIPKDVDSGIIEIEKILGESHKLPAKSTANR